MKKLQLKKFTTLGTIEEKSFWVVAPIVALMGIASLFTAGLYSSPLPTVISAITCLVIPVILMYFVYKYQNYHSAYPILCISVGAISVPISFIFSGGFHSGMPLFCVVLTILTALCYDTKLRWISLGCCVLANFAAFYYVYKNGTFYPITGDVAIYKDIIFSYCATAISTFVALNLIVSEVRKYKTNSEAFQKYFDIEKREEIIKNAINGEVKETSVVKRTAIMFADISNFTAITEKMSADQVPLFLNEFFAVAGKYIHQSNGIIDKYIGDCVMACWFEKEGINPVYSAIETALNMRNELLHKSEELYNKYGTELIFSTGIGYGDVIFGDIGSDTLHDFTVIGDAVNTASRMQDYAVSGEILISDAAALEVKDSVVMEKVESGMFFKGKNNAVNLYRVSKLKEDSVKTEVEIEESYGYQLYVCGCRGSFPVSGLRFSEYGGETSCYVLKKDEYAVVVDCGTGLKNAIDVLKKCSKIDILLTHVHYDHILGLLMSKLPSNAKIRIFGTFDVWSGSNNTLESFMEHPYWPVEIIKTDNINIKPCEEISLSEDIKATFYESDHPDNGCVIKLMVKDKKICFLADCEDAEKLDSSVAENSELVFFDGMFDDADKNLHIGWGHGTWQEGVRYAKNHNIKKLVITHHNPETGDHTLVSREKRARDEMPNVSFAKTGDRFLI